MTTIWHNPRCRKSRETLALLTERGIAPIIRLYLDDAPSAEELKDALAKLGLDHPRALMRTKEAEYRAQGLGAIDEADALIAAMTATPKLIERPVVFHKGRAALGRPPEAVLALF